MGISQTKIIKDHLALVFNKVTPDTRPYCRDKRAQQNSEWNPITFPMQVAVWNKDNWSYGDLNNFHSTGISVNFSTALEDYKKDGNVSKHGTVGFIAGPNGGHISTSEFSNFLEKTNSGQNVPPIKTNFYFGGEYQSSIDPKGVVTSC